MGRLNQIDANLLVALDVLLEERHVTRTARRLGVTQSAMSQTLRRLRETFDDPLLVRSGRAMVPTPRAQAIRQTLRAALRSLESALHDPTRFEPQHVERSFTLASLDAYGISVVPGVIHRLATAGPGLTLRVAPLNPATVWGLLRDGELDCALVGSTWDIPADFEGGSVLGEQMVGVVRQGHPLLDEAVTLERYTAWPHVAFSLTGRGNYGLDRLLEEAGHRRRIVGHIPSFLAAPSVVMASDVIVTMPRSVASQLAQHWPVRLFEPPLAPITYDIHLIWPTYLDNDPGHRWFRAQVQEASEAVAATMSACDMLACMSPPSAR